MRNALATVGHMVIAVAIAAAVSVISLTAIGRVQWPAFPSSNQLHALTTVGQVGCILGLLCAGWVWRRGRGRTLARLLALVFVSAFSVVTLGMPLGATKLYLFGISVDQQFRTEYLPRLTDSSSLHDMTYAGLPAFYPPGWFWVGGRVAALDGAPGWGAFKAWALAPVTPALPRGRADRGANRHTGLGDVQAVGDRLDHHRDRRGAGVVVAADPVRVRGDRHGR